MLVGQCGFYAVSYHLVTNIVMFIFNKEMRKMNEENKRERERERERERKHFFAGANWKVYM